MITQKEYQMIPKFDEIMLPLLQYLNDGREHSLKECSEAVSDFFQLSQEDREKETSSGQILIHNRTGWAKLYLLRAGLIVSKKRNSFSISEQGIKLLATNPKKIDKENLMQYPAFVEYVSSSKHNIANDENDESHKESHKRSRQYWWLVASPDIWSFSSIKNDEVVDYTLYNDKGNKRRVYQNFLNAKAGDYVIGYESNPVKQIVALAEIARENDGEKIYFKKTKQLSIPINYAVIQSIPELINMEFRMNPNGSFFKLTEKEYQIIMDVVREEEAKCEKKNVPAYSQDDFLNDVYINEGDYKRMRNLLLCKKNIILQGAPGVGKTFSAKRLAYSIMGEMDDDRVEMVQFHQSYTYEDFIMGYKPTENGGFAIKEGMFYKFCKKAASDTNRAYFFIIDEINRGNLSKIFGELLMLIESSYRNRPVKLAYSDKQFYVPDNLYIIGMMNTADRSLAMIDYALRRRFSFFEIRPGFDSKGFKNYQTSLSNEKFNNVIEAVKHLNEAIVKDDSLGSGFCIGHSYFCEQTTCDEEWLSNVVEFDLIPMLREYWFDNDKKFREEADRLMKLIQ